MAAAIALVLGASLLGECADAPRRAELSASGTATATVRDPGRHLASNDRQGPWCPPEAAWDGDCRPEDPDEDDGCREMTGPTPRGFLSGRSTLAEAPARRARPPLPSPSRFLGLQRFRC